MTDNLLRVGIVGQPGSGKLDLALALADRLDLAILPNAADIVREQMGVVEMVAGGFILGKSWDSELEVVNTQIATEAALLEYVTSGTVVEAYYYAQHFLKHTSRQHTPHADFLLSVALPAMRRYTHLLVIVPDYPASGFQEIVKTLKMLNKDAQVPVRYIRSALSSRRAEEAIRFLERSRQSENP